MATLSKKTRARELDREPAGEASLLDGLDVERERSGEGSREADGVRTAGWAMGALPKDWVAQSWGAPRWVTLFRKSRAREDEREVGWEEGREDGAELRPRSPESDWAGDEVR